MLLIHDNALASIQSVSRISALQVLVTRYNLPIRAFQTKVGATDAVERKRWLEARLPIFKTFCLPSVIGQTRRPDLWLLGFDAALRDAVAPVLDAIKGHTWIVPVWQGTTGESYSSWAAAITGETRRRLTDSHSHVIMSRLDNDDAIDRTYFRYVGRYASVVTSARADLREFWIMFPFGVDYARRRCFMRLYPGSAFQSIVMQRERFLEKKYYMAEHSSVLRGDHTVFLAVTPSPMWLRNIHGGNVTSERDRRARLALVPTRKALRSFSLDPHAVLSLQSEGGVARRVWAHISRLWR